MNFALLARTGERAGKWNGYPVFVCSAEDLDNKGSGAFYILYDDDNKLVKLGNDGEWYSWGTVSAGGTVDEYSSCRKYTVYRESKPVDIPTNSYTPGYEVEDKPVGDVKLEIDVEDTLKKAREMTIDDLLVGFNYGL